ncbi:MAG: hypothetical protein RLZZ262_1522 [Bacteroidota bacterium]
MSSEIQHAQIGPIIEKINQHFGIRLTVNQFNAPQYSASSLEDVLVQKIVEAQTGDWTTEMAMDRLTQAISKHTGKNATEIDADSNLAQLIPSSKRKETIAKMSADMGVPLEVLRPNPILNGIFILIFFSSIPMAVGFSWFSAIITASISAVILFILNKTGNDFKVKTLGAWADQLAWKNYLKDAKKGGEFSHDELRNTIGPWIKG